VKKKKIFNTLLLFAILYCPVFVMGQYHYEKFNSHFEVSESKSEYKVECLFTGDVSSSRMLNALENRLRMRSLDMIGTYILYKEFETKHNLEGDYFQLFATYNNFNFDATVDMLRASNFSTTERGREVTFSVKKENFVVDVTKYPLDDINLKELLYRDYKKRRDPQRALAYYKYHEFTTLDYLEVFQDFLAGRSRINPQFNILVKDKQDSRFEMSILQEPDSLHLVYFDSIAEEATYQEGVVQQAMYAELVTSAPLIDKQAYYDAFLNALDKNKTAWESMVDFCGKKKSVSLDDIEAPAMFTVIECFPGAINPYALRYSFERAIYDKAEERFAKEKIKSALDYLEQSINYEGIHTRTLNLIGATYRFDKKPEKAMPYLILAYMLDPEAQFVSGNLALCLDAMGYNHTGEFIEFLNDNAKIDPWSKNQIDTLIK